ncbi:MAG: hypothetical protein JXQ75_13805 [Phycisphaerae bacterium]|nr:hypothetical protein [Phycisphaerae bacterium]
MLKRVKQRSPIVLVAMVTAAVVWAAPANADYSSVQAPFPGELGHADILSGIYSGGSFAIQSGGRDYSNGAITATRIDDFGIGGIMNVVNGVPGAADDQVFSDGFVQASATAKYSVLPMQSFGCLLGETGDSYHKLFDVRGYGFDVTGSTDLMDAAGLTWRWGHQRRRMTGGFITHSSRPADEMNKDRDWMVTYQITGLDDGWTTWLLFWEDLFGCGCGDYNDIVVEVRAAPIPAPGAAVLGVVGLGLIGWFRRRVS